MNIEEININIKVNHHNLNKKQKNTKELRTKNRLIFFNILQHEFNYKLTR
jgi:hypothetical protein